MFSYFLLTLVVVGARVIPRTAQPLGWDTQFLESYDTFSCRYLALQCEYKHNTNFYNSCCTPLAVNETMSSRPANCQLPSNTTCGNGVPAPTNGSNTTLLVSTLSPPAANLAAPLPTTTNTDDGCGEEPSSTPSMIPVHPPTSSPVLLAPTPTTSNPEDGCGDEPSSTPTVSVSPTPTVTGDDGCGEGTSTPSQAPTISSPVITPSPAATNTDGSCGNETSSTPSASLGAPTTSSTLFTPSTTFSTPSAAPITTAAPVNVAPVPTTTSSSPAVSSPTAPSSDSSNGPFTGGVATYFYQNGVPGACGQVHQDTDYICAMDQARYGDSGNASPLCGQQVQITNLNNGQTVTVTIADDCPTCENANSIDLSVAAFEAISDLSVGEVPISWVFLN